MLFKNSIEGGIFLNCIFVNTSHVLICQDGEALVTWLLCPWDQLGEGNREGREGGGREKVRDREGDSLPHPLETPSALTEKEGSASIISAMALQVWESRRAEEDSILSKLGQFLFLFPDQA